MCWRLLWLSSIACKRSMLDKLSIYKSRNHCTINSLNHIGISIQFMRKRSNFRDSCSTLCGALTSSVDFLKRAACMTKPPRSAIKATILRSITSMFERTSSRELQVTALFNFYSLLLSHNAEHSGDLGMATKEPWKGRPAAIGRVLLRLVKGLFTLGFYWAPNAECQLPILCASLTHCARNQATE